MEAQAMADPWFKERVRPARISVTINRREWGGAATIRCTDWRLDDWAALAEDQVKHVIYIPGAFADFAQHAPLALLEEGVQRGVPLRVTTVDLPEFGPSRLPPGWAGRMARAGSFEDDATLLQAVVDRVAPGRYTLVGWSTGANQAAIMAAVAPERVEAIELCMPGGFFTQPVLTSLTPRFTWTVLTTLRNSEQRRRMMSDRPVELNLELLVSLYKLPAIVQMIRLLGRDNAVPYAARVRCPVVFILGRHDIVFQRLLAMHDRGELAALFPQAPSVTVHILEEGTHNAFSTHSDEVAALTLDTLTTRVPARD
jgi:pimeloyl-ACP methyl ester carboxylesterase